jgi:hypothetical protein
VAASTSSSTSRKCSMALITSGPMRVANKGDTGVPTPLEKIAPGAS